MRPKEADTHQKEIPNEADTQQIITKYAFRHCPKAPKMRTDSKYKQNLHSQAVPKRAKQVATVNRTKTALQGLARTTQRGGYAAFLARS